MYQKDLDKWMSRELERPCQVRGEMTTDRALFHGFHGIDQREEYRANNGAGCRSRGVGGEQMRPIARMRLGLTMCSLPSISLLLMTLHA